MVSSMPTHCPDFSRTTRDGSGPPIQCRGAVRPRLEATSRMSDSEPFDVVPISGITVVVFRPSYSQLDESTIDLVNRKLVDLVTGLDSPSLVLDLTNVNFFGSSFIEAMFRVWKRLQSRPDGRFALCGLNPYCREVLEVTHLDKLWPMYSTQPEAVSQLQS